MRPIFTVHAGEYLAADALEGLKKGLRVWIPSKDDGIDLLVTDEKMRKAVSLQVKFSKDFYPNVDSQRIKGGIVSTGFFKFAPSQIKKSRADYWVLVVPSFFHKKTNFLIISPRDFYFRLKKIHGRDKSPFFYIWVAEKKKCFEVRGLGKHDLEDVGRGHFEDSSRDLSDVLNNWKPILKKLD